MAAQYRIEVDLDKCVGSTLCTHFASGVFALDERGQSAVVNIDGEVAADILEAAEQCPQCAIILTDAQTGTQVFP